MYAEDISRCTSTPRFPDKPNATVYERSLFSRPGVFENSRINVSRCVEFYKIVATLH